MRHKQKLLWGRRQLALVLMRVVVIVALTLVALPTQAATEFPSGEAGVEQTKELGPEGPDPEMEPQEPPEWWYDPNVARVSSGTEELEEPPEWWYDPEKPLEISEAAEVFEQPEWWYVLQDDQKLSTQDFTTMDVLISLPSGQSLNAGAIPLDILVVADGTTPEIVVQVESQQVPDKAVYAGHEKIPDGTVQVVGGFQQARFAGGVGPSNTAEITFKYEPLNVGWISFEVEVWSEGNLIRGPENHSVYVSPVSSPTFTNMDINVNVASNWDLNAGAIPLNVAVMADGTTPELIVQVTSDDVPDRAVYVGHEKTPDGTIQVVGGFQQARFVGGVGPSNIAEIKFKYEPLTVGWINFTVQVWSVSEDNLIHGPETHSVYISPAVPTFTNFEILVLPVGSQGLNAGVIPFEVRVVADGKMPQLIVQVTSDDVPGRAVYAGYEKVPEGAMQALVGFQQARFMGGVGPDNVAAVTFKYEPVMVGWIDFTVRVWSEGNLLYGPERHWVYIRQTGSWTATFPPLIRDFSVASQVPQQVTFNIDVSGNPYPQYELACGGDGADATVEGHSCVYHRAGEYTATLMASNYVEGVGYSEVATTTVFVFREQRFPRYSLYLPLVVRNNH